MEILRIKKYRNIALIFWLLAVELPGVVAAIQSARAGCKTTLLENSNQLGGTMTTGGRCLPRAVPCLGKAGRAGIGWELVSEAVALNGDILPDFTIPFGRSHPKHQIPLNAPLYAILAEEKCIQAGVTLRYYETPVRITRQNDQWMVDVAGKGTQCRIVCNQVIDCTGNALVVSMAGYNLLKETETQAGIPHFRTGWL